MSENILDGVTVSSGGGTDTGTFAKSRDVDEVVLRVDGDSNTSDVDLTVTRGAFGFGDTQADLETQPSATTVDATTDANNTKLVRLTGLRGYRECTLQVKNDHSSDTTVTVTQHDR
jgi:hypothetical protein